MSGPQSTIRDDPASVSRSGSSPNLLVDSPKNLLVLGGTSDIGRATALAFAQSGWRPHLAGRNLALLKREADNIFARTRVPVAIYGFDVLDTHSFAAFVESLPVLPDAVVSVIGILGDQAKAQGDLDLATVIMRSNYEGPALILGLFAERFIKRGSGVIVGVSSVAGDRGRPSNYIYGSAKAGLTAFLSGLRGRCLQYGVHVSTVKPGFVRTKMTEGMKLSPALTSEPMAVGQAILRASERQSDVVYVGPIWRLIMTVIGSIPEPVFKRLKLG